jgi:hypothetical protein
VGFEINKLFDRNFVVAYFVPALVGWCAIVGILHAFGQQPSWLAVDLNDWEKLTTLVVLALLTAILLMALNREIFRTLEGYWWPRWTRAPLRWMWLWRFRRATTLAEQTAADDSLAAQYARLSVALADWFPSQEDQVLPTSFGNTVRAVEDYPRVMYGIESITGWPRISAVVSKEFAEMLNSARATTDMWVNAWFVSVLVLPVYIACAFATYHLTFWTIPPYWWMPVSVLAAAYFAYWRAREAAAQWGGYVKAAFDVYLPVLRKQLGYKVPTSIAEERELWTLLSQAMTYRDPRPMDETEKFRAHS